ncbi:cytochrome P450 family protein [Amycolatopsis nigrescens]|uniref:cytochrome P450 family protein n=1 Tax=Amycolatopsis nigrescens TaxID=381445 RepID=UPI0003658ADC|nr:cytochrome P450 [Amycolatopsis nigrescens]
MGDESEVLDDEFFADPHRVYRRLRERGSVHRLQYPTGLPGWVITGYAESRAALADPRLRKAVAGSEKLLSEHGRAVSNAGQSLTNNMLNADPPDHTRLRKLVNKAFTPGATEKLRPRIEEITAGLLDDMAARDEVDLMEAFAVPLPTTVICELLGVPFADRDEFRGWIITLLTADSRDRPAAAREMTRYLTGLVQAKRERPADDLLSALVHARDEDDRLSERELVSTAFLLLVAGHETTVNLIGNGMHALLCDEKQLDALLADPALIPAAVEEFLRYDGPVNLATTRYTGEPVVIDGTEIPAGEFVHIALTSANRDPAKFDEPDRLDFDRESAGHVAFGHGIHYCVGAPLARMEAEIAFSALLRRFPRLRPAGPATAPHWLSSGRIRGLTALPVLLNGS